MVGVGPEGAESSLARVSIVNYHGAVQLDCIVKQRERVSDYRTQWSGIRPSDMTRAQPFEEVQTAVAGLLEGRVLVGHAVHNDLKVLMLGHPRGMTRDTQYHAGKARMTGTNRPALRNLVKQEVGVVIQEGEHSSVYTHFFNLIKLASNRLNCCAGYRCTRDNGTVQITS